MSYPPYEIGDDGRAEYPIRALSDVLPAHPVGRPGPYQIWGGGEGGDMLG